jgi:hypothetical protein
MTEETKPSLPKDFDFNNKIDVLLLNMSGGLLLPKNLNEDEVNLLRDRFGPDWFAKLGYSEPEYERPKPTATCYGVAASGPW